jgi:hypothetical protein
MEVEKDVMNLIVNQVHKVNLINVSHMEAENDVMNLIVNQVHTVKVINV